MSRKSAMVCPEYEREIDRVLEGYRNETYAVATQDGYDPTQIGQPRHWSTIESIVNVCVGYLVAVIATQLILPHLGFAVSIEQNLIISAIFTGISLIRSYALRRFFNWVHLNGLRH